MRTPIAIIFLLASLAGPCSPAFADATPAPSIREARADGPVLHVYGSNLAGGTPTLTLGASAPLPLLSVSATQIDALISATAPGSYLLTLSVSPSGKAGSSSALVDEFWVSLGAVGPAGPQGIPGPAGATGPQGPAGPAGTSAITSLSSLAGIPCDVPTSFGALRVDVSNGVVMLTCVPTKDASVPPLAALSVVQTGSNPFVFEVTVYLSDLVPPSATEPAVVSIEPPPLFAPYVPSTLSVSPGDVRATKTVTLDPGVVSIGSFNPFRATLFGKTVTTMAIQNEGF